MVSGILYNGNASSPNFLNLNASGAQEFIKVGSVISIYANGSATFGGTISSNTFTTLHANFAGSVEFRNYADVIGVDGSGARLRIRDYQSFSGFTLTRGELWADTGAVTLDSAADLVLNAIGGGLGSVILAHGGQGVLTTTAIQTGVGVVSGVILSVREDAGGIGLRVIYVDGPDTAGTGWRQLRVRNNATPFP
jgi:hypothetical protein